MFNFFDLYPMIFLTIFYFIFGYMYGTMINNRIFPEFKKGIQTKNLIMRIIFMLNVIVFSFFLFTKLSQQITLNLKVEQIYVDASKTIFGFSFFKVQTKLQNHMNSLNERTRLG